MKRNLVLALVALGLGVCSASAQQQVKAPAGTPVNITVAPATPSAPPLSITLGPRHGHVTPERAGCTHTGGGNIDIQQPAPDTLVITMTGVAVAGPMPVHGSTASMSFDLQQVLDISFDNPKVKKGKLTIEGRVIGLLRGNKHGTGAADFSNATATVSGNHTPAAAMTVPPHNVAGKDYLSMNCHEGPQSVPVTAGTYALHQTFTISANHNGCLGLGRPCSAEFAPDPALDPLWISYWEPFHGAAKKDFGFQVTIKVGEGD